MSAHDFNSTRQNRLLGMIQSTQSRLTNALGTVCVRTDHGLLAAARVQRVRAAAWWRASLSRIHMPRSILVSGVCPIDVSREPAGHRDVSARDGRENVS